MFFEFILQIRESILFNDCSLLNLYHGLVITFSNFVVFLYNNPLVYRKEIDYFCVVHETGRGLFAQSKGRPSGSKNISLPCPTSTMDKIIELRKDFGLNNETKMLVMLSLSTSDMNRYVAMYPEVWFVDCTAGMCIRNVY